ncbi:helicase HerA domain-containing protein [Glycomyces albidus]|uniref:DUF87 domain-containing protein n=1 Tax=Glycomyces albidus TaxID=2656774 RepID=A0A6L5GHJ5_9ACTN|nr:DUF87 domain-containing protein [Glycomyces albidus]MQM28863.1 DUF87 domain-containing protein [Glycomyces albidus]
MSLDPSLRRALEALLKLDLTVQFTDVWKDADVNVELHNHDAAQELRRSLEEAEQLRHTKALGLVVHGEAGSGKTHLVREGRMALERGGGLFVQMDVNRDEDFATAALLSFVFSLTEGTGKDGQQVQLLLKKLLENAELADEHRWGIKDYYPTPEAVDAVVAAVHAEFGYLDGTARDVVRALCLLSSRNPADLGIAEDWLSCREEVGTGRRERWGIHPATRRPREVLLALTKVVSLVGPVLFCIDQIDEIVQKADLNTAGVSPHGDLDAQLSNLAMGLMDFIEQSRRTLTVVSCLPGSWSRLEAATLQSVPGRFWSPRALDEHLTGDAARAIIARHVEARLADVKFKAPWAGWPAAPEAFNQKLLNTPRQILRSVQDHARRCLDQDDFEPLRSLVPDAGVGPVREPESVAARFEQILREVDVASALSHEHEDTDLPPLLVAGFRAYATETGTPMNVHPLRKPKFNGIHAVLRQDDRRWCLRGVAQGRGVAFKARLNWLFEQSGAEQDLDAVAVALRTRPWELTETAQQNLLELQKRGLRVIDLDPGELRVCAALKQLEAERHPEYETWLCATRPMSGTALVRNIFDEQGGEPPPPGPETLPMPHPLPLGGFEDGTPASVDLERLRKHVAVFAGSGSGKTVVLRRLIEECALQGVSSIVLDPNNDLARLGEPWPSPPAAWSLGDAEKAAAYFADTEVVVWTPRLAKGRPVSFQPLPDFGAVIDDEDEFESALDSAVAALAPRAKVAGNTDRHEQARAVIRQGLMHYARNGGDGLEGFLQLLADFPDDVVNLSKATEIAHKVAETLRASQINDPLFGGDGAPLDPGELLKPSRGKRARVSVVSLIGLPDAAQRQGFVNQLQMGLFAWIKRHPAGDRPLGGLFVMDEAQTFAPSGAMTPCTGSTLALASQARKYGLGLVFATQAPRGVHNQVVGNCATQFVGFLNHPTQVAAVKDMVDAKQAKDLQVTELVAGDFYLKTEGRPHRRVTTPMCLSHHPKSALTPEEVVSLARREH